MNEPRPQSEDQAGPDYDVEYAGDLASLAKAVRARQAQGWRPQGGVACYNVHEKDGYGTTWVENWFAQAVVRHG